jgi:hypothetical protein
VVYPVTTYRRFAKVYEEQNRLSKAVCEEIHARHPEIGIRYYKLYGSAHLDVWASPEQREKIREWIKASIDRQLPPRFPIYVHFLDEIEAEMIKPSSR